VNNKEQTYLDKNYLDKNNLEDIHYLLDNTFYMVNKSELVLAVVVAVVAVVAVVVV
jgi:hypothetical protein